MADEERKDEYTIDDLFRVSMERDIPIMGREVSVMLKTLGDSDARMRQRLGFKASSTALKEIDDSDSLLYSERIAPLAEMSNDDLVIALRSVKEAQFLEEAEKDILPMAPDDESYEGLTGMAEKEEFEKAEAKRVEEERREFARAAAKEYVDNLRKSRQFRETATTEITSFVREVAAREALQVTWTTATLFYGAWKPGGKERFYPTMEDWENANPEFKRLCLEAYLDLDKASRDPNILSALR